jgi:hypothetical protein
MKNTLLVLLVAFSAQLTAFSQAKKPAAKPTQKELFTFYTLKEGVKTKINPTDKIVIKVKENGMHEINIGIEFSVQEFHKKYPYDLIAVEVFNETKRRSYSNIRYMNFVDEGEAKLMAQMTTKKFTLYPESQGEFKDATSMFWTTETISPDWKGDSLTFRIAGAYSNGTETYYDEQNSSVRSRHTFTAYTTILNSLSLSFEYDPKYIRGSIDSKLHSKIDDDYYETFKFKDVEYLTKKGVLKTYLENTAYESPLTVMVATQEFIKTYFETKYKTLEVDRNSTMFIDKWINFVTETAYLNLANLSVDEKKAIDKLIKKNKSLSLDEIAALVKAANPKPQVIVIDYSKAY